MTPAQVLAFLARIVDRAESDGRHEVEVDPVVLVLAMTALLDHPSPQRFPVWSLAEDSHVPALRVSTVLVKAAR